MHEKCRFLELEKPHLFHRHGCLDLQEIQLRNDTNAEAKDAQMKLRKKELFALDMMQKWNAKKLSARNAQYVGGNFRQAKFELNYAAVRDEW